MQPSKTQKHYFKTLLVIATVFLGFLASCSDDDDPIVDPQARVPFIGSYQVKDQNSDESQYFSFTLHIQESTKGPDKVDLKNFRYINNGIYGTIVGNQLIISQVLQDSDEKVEVTGSGTLEGNKLTYSYKIVLTEKGKAPRMFENSAEATKME